MEFTELNLEQRRRLVDARQVFEAWRDASIERRRGRGSMRWKAVGGKEYLFSRKYRGVEHSRGVRSEETERIEAEFLQNRERLEKRVNQLGDRLSSMARVNRALNLGRVPTLAARILRKLDDEGLLGDHLTVVGTHAMFAYEAAAGIIFDEGLTATEDLDLLWDARRRLRIALVDVQADGVMGILKKVDRSFKRLRNYRAANADGYYVDLIRPPEKDEMLSTLRGVGDSDDDLEAAAIEGLWWLINSPKFEQIVMGADGVPFRMACVDPRAFALHKYWISKRADRDPLKRRRDHAQALAVATVVAQYLEMPFEGKDLTAIPADVAREAAALLAAA
jgi:hypothetical protein